MSNAASAAYTANKHNTDAAAAALTPLIESVGKAYIRVIGLEGLGQAIGQSIIAATTIASVAYLLEALLTPPQPLPPARATSVLYLPGLVPKQNQII